MADLQVAAWLWPIRLDLCRYVTVHVDGSSK